MKERPILFSAQMVKAILSGAKTQTRRAVNPQPQPPGVLTTGDGCWRRMGRDGLAHVFDWERECPYGQAGDRLWVREVWTGSFHLDSFHVAYAADGSERFTEAPLGYILPKAALKPSNWVTPLFMPRWASRITLEITDVRVQRLQDISEKDAKAEGFTWEDVWKYSDLFKELWDSINGKKHPWSENCWVWAITFKRI
jgi:hypothetical protein